MSRKNRLSLVTLFMAVFLFMSAFTVFAQNPTPTISDLPNNHGTTIEENSASPTPITQPNEDDAAQAHVENKDAEDFDFPQLEEQSKSFEELSYEKKIQYFVDNGIASEEDAKDLADENKRDTGQLAELAASSAEYYQNELAKFENEGDNRVLAQVKSLLRGSLARSIDHATITNNGLWVERPYPDFNYRTKALVLNPGPGQRVGFCVDPYLSFPTGESYIGEYHSNSTVAKILYWGYGGPHTGALLERYEQMGVPDPFGYAYCDTINAVRVVTGVTDTPGIVNDGCVQWLINHEPIPNPFSMPSHDKNATYDATAKEKISEWFETSGDPHLGTSFVVQVRGGLGVQREGDPTVYRSDQSWPVGTKFRIYLPWQYLGQHRISLSYTHNAFQDFIYNNDDPELQRAIAHKLTPVNASTEIRVNAIPMPPEPIDGEVKIVKQDSVTGETPQGNASLDGAVFQLIRDGSVLKEATIKDNKASFGKVQVGTIQPETGELVDSYTFQVKEKTPGKGYWVNKETFTITPGKTEVVTVTAKNDVRRGGVQIQKVDKETGKPLPQGDASLKAAEFTIINRSTNSVFVDGKVVAKDTVCKIIKTDDKGYAATAIDSLPYGDYEIYESKASPGNKIDANWRKTFTISEDNQLVDIRNETVKEPIIRGGVQIRKYDKELGKSEALGGADHGKNEYGTHLEGIVFTIRNKSAHNVMVDEKEYEPNKDVKTITTHWNEKEKAYTAETAADSLPYGTYTIRETTTTDSYLLSDGVERTFIIRDDGVIVTADRDNKILIFNNQVIRGDFRMVKIADGTSERLSVPWLLTNTTTGERHVVVTDKNGEFSSHADDRLHSKDMNINDGLIKKFENNQVIKQSEMKVNTGLWFGQGEDKSMAGVSDKLGAMPFGKYTLGEMRCEANEGYKLQTISFSIYRDGYTVDLGTITDDKIEIETLALDVKTKTHTSFAGEDCIIGDTVSLSGLTKGTEYEIRGRLVNLADGSDLVIDGEKVTAAKAFKATKDTAELKMNYKLDASALAGKSVVVFVDLIQLPDESTIAKHHELDNEHQTIHFPAIKTTATDKSSGNHFGRPGETVTITDQVAYSNLTPGDFYTVKGLLMNQSTGEKLLDAEGREITAEKEFFADNANGLAELTFTFDGSLLAGTTVVVFEDLYADNIKVATHSDLEDKDQTVYYPAIGTSAVDGNTSHKEILAEGSVTIKDAVHYESMPIGREVTIKGVLMDSDSGEPLFIDDKPVTSEVVFSTTKSTGDIDVLFTFDASGLAGRTFVVFEKAYLGDYLLAEHEDLEDEAQTIRFPVIKTTATELDSKSHYAQASEKTTIVDQVAYNNLTPGNTYQMVGTLYIKTGENKGEPLLIDGKPITSSKEFVANETTGFVELAFVVDSRALVGKTIVVFEDCFVDKIKVATHADIEDENQSVHIIQIGTKAWDKTTQGKIMTYSEAATITDTVAIEGYFCKDTTYILQAIVMDKASGKPLKIGSDEVRAVRRFTLADITPAEEQSEVPTKENGSYIKGTIDVDIPINIMAVATSYERELVVFETLHIEGHDKPIASHEDLDDKEQTVIVKPLENPNPQTGLLSTQSGKTAALVVAVVLVAIGTTLLRYRRRLSRR